MCNEYHFRYDEVNVTNFHTSWKDGLAFCAILDRHRPDLLNYDDCDPDTPLTNLETAMSVAEKELGIVRIIDPEGDLINACFHDNHTNLP